MSDTLSDDINDYCFFDFETRALPHLKPDDPAANVVTAGTYRYAKNAFAIILTWAIGDGPEQIAALDLHFNPVNGHYGLDWRTLPSDLKTFYIRAELGLAWFAAWHTNFDRQTWNQNKTFPGLRVNMTIDVMAQAMSSGLPGKLEGASHAIGRGGKQPDGKKLIKQFCTPDGDHPRDDLEAYGRFNSYGLQDITELREIFKATRPLPASEWAEYWTSEDINDRGIAVDLYFCARAAAVSEFNIGVSNTEINRITKGVVTKVTQVGRIAKWVYERLAYAETRDMLTKEYDPEADVETGEFKATKLSLAKENIEKVLAFFDTVEKECGLTDVDFDVYDVLQFRLFGGSASPKKFGKIVDQADDERLRGQYRFNGAPGSGRFSSMNVQIHNLVRASLGKREIEAIDMISDLELVS